MQINKKRMLGDLEKLLAQRIYALTRGEYCPASDLVTVRHSYVTKKPWAKTPMLSAHILQS